MQHWDRKRHAAARRTVLRDNAGLRAEVDRLSSLERGSSFERPVEVTSASEVEVRAAAMPCPVCAGVCRVQEHSVEWRGQARRRVVRVRCEMCGGGRRVYFRLGSALPS